MGSRATPTSTAPAEGPKVSILGPDEAAKASVRKKRPPLSAAAQTILGTDRLGNGGLF